MKLTINDLKNGVHIPNFEAKNIIYRQETKTALYINHGAVLPFSLDLLELYRIVPKAFYKVGEQIYTNIVCNVKFDDKYYEYNDIERHTYNEKKDKVITYKNSRGKLIMNQQELRDQLYLNGFKLYKKDIKDDNESPKDFDNYVQYKRSSSKSRVNNTLFIKDSCYKHMINWSRLNIKFPKTIIPDKMKKKEKIQFEEEHGHEKFDLASLKSYESLPLSSLVDIIDIHPTHILIIDDSQAKVMFRASVTSLDEHKMPLVETIDNYTVKHDVWDGQGLISYDIIKNRPDSDKSMYLLRERWLKCCAFSTNLQEYFKKRCNDEGRDYDTATTNNMFGDTMLLKDIDLVITPDSLKLLKFSEFVDDPDYEYSESLNEKKNQQRKAFNYWVRNVNQFGLVKSEHESAWGTYQQATYQFNNSLDLNEEEINELLQPEYDYIDKLKNDILVFKNHYNNNYVSKNKSFILNLLAVNPEAEHTALFKNYRHSVITKYINSLRQGAIKLQNCDYQVLFSSPYEMLCAAYGDKIDKPLINRDNKIEIGAVEVYSKKYPDGQYICGWRNPHINSGNIVYAKNVYHPEYEYFNLSKNIIVIDGWSNFNEITQGSDMDSDTFCSSSLKLLANKAKEMIQSGKYPVPINNITLDKTLRYNNAKESSAIDNIVAQNNIGVVCNWSQICNSYYWDCKHKGATQVELDEIYKKSSLCSSLSQLEIDKSKKYFDSKTISIQKCLSTIYDLRYKGNPLIQFVEIPLKKCNINDQEANTIKDLQQQLKSKQITKAEYLQKLDDTLIMTELKDNGEKSQLIIKKPYRPHFYGYLDTGDKNQCADINNAWYCPMDILEQLLNKIQYRDYTKTVPISSIVNLDKNNKADRKQIIKIFNKVYKYKQAVKKMWQEEGNSYKENKSNEEELYDKLKQYIGKLKISESTCQHILYLCYVVPNKKTSVFKYKADKESKIKEIRYSSIAMDTCGIIWNTHPDIFKKCFISLSNGQVPHLEKIVNSSYYDAVIWGEKYKKVYA